VCQSVSVSVSQSVCQSVSAFTGVRGFCSVLIDVGVDWGFLEGRRCRVDYGKVDVEGVAVLGP
jgi:hypothetical protein